MNYCCKICNLKDACIYITLKNGNNRKNCSRVILEQQIIEIASQLFKKWQQNMEGCEVHGCNIDWWTEQFKKDLENS